MTSKEKIIEALLYMQGENGLTPEQLKEVFKLETQSVAKSMLVKFRELLNSEKRGLMIEEYNNVYKLVTIPEVKSHIEEFATGEQKAKLSDPALEVIGIVAYKTPISRSSISAIRGKNSDYLVNSLLLKGLIEEVGIAKTPGNPILYGITNKFYDYFRIRSIHELPKFSEFQNIDFDAEVDEEIDLYSSQRDD